MTKFALQRAMGAETARNVSAFRRSARTARRVRHYGGRYVSVDVLLTWGTTRFSSVSVRHDARRSRQSNYKVGKLFTHAFNMMTGFSTMPLQIASWSASFSPCSGSGSSCGTGRPRSRTGSTVQGFAFLASIIAIFTGAQLFALGILGEYLARIHFRMMDRPAYIVPDVDRRRLTRRSVAASHEE